MRKSNKSMLARKLLPFLLNAGSFHKMVRHVEEKLKERRVEKGRAGSERGGGRERLFCHIRQKVGGC